MDYDNDNWEHYDPFDPSATWDPIPWVNPTETTLEGFVTKVIVEQLDTRDQIKFRLREPGSTEDIEYIFWFFLDQDHITALSMYHLLADALEMNLRTTITAWLPTGIGLSGEYSLVTSIRVAF